MEASTPAAGSVLGTLEDGAVVTQGEEGRRIFTYLDGRIVTQNSEGDTESERATSIEDSFFRMYVANIAQY